MMYSTAVWLSTGSVPGSPEHTGQQREFGSPPNSAEQVQNIFDFVRSSACISRPIVGYKSDIVSALLSYNVQRTGEKVLSNASAVWIIVASSKRLPTIDIPIGIPAAL